VRFRPHVIAGAALVVLGLSACTSGTGSPSNTRPTSAAATQAATTPSPATPATSAPSPSATTLGPLPFHSAADGFSVTFADQPAGATVDEFDTTMATKTGKRPARSYGPPNQIVVVYKPRESNPWAALEANRAWYYTMDHSSFKGNPAILVVQKADHQAPKDPFRNVVLKVWRNGKIYWLMMVAPRGLKQAQAFYNSLNFDK